MSDETTMPQEEPRDESPESQEQAPLPEVSVEDVLRFSIGLFNEQAWVQLGIRANPSTGATNADLAQAKLAIDALAALIPLTEGRFEAHDVRDLKNLLSGLQMNFVQRKTASSE